MTIAIIGATGQLGGHTIDFLLQRGVAASDILALGRNQDRLTALADLGLRTAPLDLADARATASTLSGVDTLLLISVGGPGEGVPPRAAAVDAAREAGVGHLVYTSALRAPTTALFIAADHKATEQIITEAGIPATFLRNGWYTENHQQDFAAARERGVIANSVGAGRLATAPRREYAEATAIVLTTPGHEGAAYELSGDVAWTYADFAAAAAEALNSPVRYDALTAQQEHEQLTAAGLDDGTASFFVKLHGNMRDDVLATTTGDLAKLLGRATEPLAVTLRAWS
ncbi:MAG: NmrA family protein [Acidimicrobiia bacterium]|nr:NmrA family protein [Acidimicrobiia bacterium]